MTQIINDKLKKLCDKCRNDKSCAWISLGNEYCDDIMEAQKEIEQLKKQNENLKKELKDLQNRFDNLMEAHKICDEDNERLNNIIDELEEWFKGYHKSQNHLSWYEEDYIEFIEHLENELKGSDE